MKAASAGPRGYVAFIDDEPDLCAAAEDFLTASGFVVQLFEDPIKARDQLDLAQVDVVVSDLRMPGLMGDALLLALQERDPDLPVVLISAHADVPVAVAAMRQGAHDFLEKPYLPEHLLVVLDRAVEWRRLRRDLAQAQNPMPRARQARVEAELLGASAAVAALRHAVLQLADVPVDVLIQGPQGSGREALARLIHDLSRRAKKPFVALDCRAVSEEAMAMELFGYERGAAMGRSGERHSRFEFASGGTIYLAEIEALSPELQMRLFRSLQDRAVVRLGGHQPRPVDVRVIAATSADLERQMEAGAFRQDLYFRLSAAQLRAPALRERLEDLAPLYLQALGQAAARLRRPLPEPTSAQIEALKSRDWPGNLAELQALAERHVLGLRPDLPLEPSKAAPSLLREGQNLQQRMAELEAAIITEALREAQGSSALAAERLGLPRRTLNEKIARLGLRD